MSATELVFGRHRAALRLAAILSVSLTQPACAAPPAAVTDADIERAKQSQPAISDQDIERARQRNPMPSDAELRRLEVDGMTPLQALTLLAELKKRLC